MLLLNWEIRV